MPSVAAQAIAAHTAAGHGAKAAAKEASGVEALFAAMLAGENGADATDAAASAANDIGAQIKDGKPAAKPGTTKAVDPTATLARILSVTANKHAPAATKRAQVQTSTPQSPGESDLAAAPADASAKSAAKDKTKKAEKTDGHEAAPLLAQQAVPAQASQPIQLATKTSDGAAPTKIAADAPRAAGKQAPQTNSDAPQTQEAAQQEAAKAGPQEAKLQSSATKAPIQDGKPATPEATAPKPQSAAAAKPAQAAAKAATLESALAALTPANTATPAIAAAAMRAKSAAPATTERTAPRAANADASRQHAKGTAATSAKQAQPDMAAAKPLPAAADTSAPKNDHAGAQARDHGTHSDGGQKNTAAAQTAPQPAAQTPQPQFQIAHAPQAADPSLAAQAAGVTHTSAPAHVQASLTVMPHADAAQHGVPLSDPGQLALSIAQQSQNGTKHFDIALHPQDLGSIHVHLSVDHTGAAQAHLSADSHHTLQLLQRDAGDLQRSLKEAGVDLAGGGLSFSLKDQQQQAGGRTPRGPSRPLSVAAVAQASASSATISNYNLAAGNARLDIRV